VAQRLAIEAEAHRLVLDVAEPFDVGVDDADEQPRLRSPARHSGSTMLSTICVNVNGSPSTIVAPECRRSGRRCGRPLARVDLLVLLAPVQADETPGEVVVDGCRRARGNDEREERE
jgi:hypothetical protein